MYYDIERIQRQVDAIEAAIRKGRVKNIYAAKNKIKTLLTKIASMKHYNFLAQ